ncbi:MAG: aminotransferase class V-fold PLP-dependent enzyme [bacterium]
MTPDERAQIAEWRADTPGTEHRVHLNNAGAGLMPRSVSSVLRDHIELESVVGGYEAADMRRTQLAKVYEHIADLCATRPDNIAITSSATAAFVQAVSVHAFEPGDVIITSRLDYTSYQIQYLALAERYGVVVLHAPDLPEGGVDPDGVRVLLAQNPRCKLVSITWIPTHTGTIQDVTAIGAICEAAGVTYHIDACQAIGQLPIDVSALKCDYLSATGRKFLRGPRGTGFLYVSERALARGDRPLHIDMRGATWTAPNEYLPATSAKRFEEWEFAYALVLGLGEAARYAIAANVDACGQRAIALGAYTRARLVELPGATVLDRGRNLSAVVTASFAGQDGREIVRALTERRINTVASLRWFGLLDFGERGVETAVRISPHYYNTEQEIDRLIDALHDVLDLAS